MNDSNQSAASQSIARDGMWLMADHIIGMVVALGLSIMVARILGPTKMGYYNFLVWAAQMLRVITDVGVPLAVRRYVSEYRGRGDPVMIATIAAVAERFQRAMAVVAVAGALIFVFTSAPGEHRAYAALIMLSVAPSLLIGVPASVLWATGHLGISVRASLAGVCVNGVLTVAVLLLGYGLHGLAAVLLFSRSFDFLLRYVAYRRIRRKYPAPAAKLPDDLKARVRQFCWHQTLLILIELVIWNRSELFFLERYSDIREVAFYSLTFNLMQYVLVLPQIMAASVGATMMVKQGEAPEAVGKMASAAVWFTLIFAVPACAGVAAISDALVRLMYGSEYLPAIPVLTLLASFGLARALSYPVLELLYVTERQSFAVRWSLLMVAVNVGLSIWWIPGNGAVGAALVKGVVQILSVAGLWFHAAHAIALRVPLLRVLRLLAAAVAMGLSVHALSLVVPPALAVGIGIPLGVVIFLIMLRVTRALDAADGQRLRALQKYVPSALRGHYARLLGMLAPTP